MRRLTNSSVTQLSLLMEKGIEERDEYSPKGRSKKGPKGPLNESTFSTFYSSRTHEEEEALYLLGHKQNAAALSPKYSYTDKLKEYFPIYETLKNYNREKAFADVVSGLILVAILIPQAMSYAVLADLPPINGLYCSIFPPLLYAFFGTYQHLSVGPFALVSLMFGDALLKLDATEDNKAAIASYLTLTIGLISILLGVLRLGSVDIFMSDSNVSGIYAASGITICTSQLKYFLGLPIPRYEDPFSLLKIWGYIFTNLNHINWAAFAVGSVSFIFIILVSKYEKDYWVPRFKVNFPSALVVVIVTTIISGASQWSERHVVPVVGFIPPGLPTFQAYPWDGTINFTTLISSSIPIAIVTHLITMSVGRSLASKYNVPAPSSNQELLALGIGTVVSAFTGGYASCASLSRSAVLASAGAASPMAAGVVSVLVLVVMMQFFTAYLKPLPMAALAAVVMSALMSVFTELSKPKKFYKVKKTDCYVWMSSFFGILLLGVEQGIILGVTVNLAFVMAGITSPNVSILGSIEGTTFYRDQARYPGVAISVPNVLIIRFEGPILFPNKNYLSTVVYSLQKQYSSESNPITAVILDASPVNDIDNAGVASLISIKKTLKAKGVNFLISAVKGGVRDVLIAGSYEITDVFVSTHDAVLFVKPEPDGDDAGAEESKFVEQPHHIASSEEVSPKAQKAAHEYSVGLLPSEDGKRATAV